MSSTPTAAASAGTGHHSPVHLTARLRRHGFVLVGAGALLAYLLWTVSSSGDPFTFVSRDNGYYNLLTNAFLAGKLHLLVEPAPGLLHLANPYDPVANAPYPKLHDASLYHGHYFMTWGPVPVILLYLPVRLLSIGAMPDSLAVALFAFVGTCFAVALLRYLARRYMPKTPLWMLALGTVGIAAGSAIPFTLRRIAVYEVAISAGYCMTFVGLFFLVTGMLESPRSLRRLTLGSLFLGLAVGCRQTMVLPAVLPIVALAWILVRERPTMRRRSIEVAAALAGPVLACAFVLAAYDVLRFGSITEFGQSYQLAGYDVTKTVTADPSYILPGLWSYLVARAQITASFPFFHVLQPLGSYPGRQPAGYGGVEPTAGLLTDVPITVLALLTWPALRGRDHRGIRVVATTLAAVGFGLVLVLSERFGVTMRYEVDFAALLLVPSLLVWFALSGGTFRPWVRRAAKAVGAVAVVWGILFGLAIGLVGYSNSLLFSQPGTYEFLERATAPIATVLARLHGGPEIVRVDPPDATGNPNPANIGLSTERTTLYVVAPSSGRYQLLAGPTGGVWKPTKNLCRNGSFEANTAGWAAFRGDETLTRVTTDHALGGVAALKVTIPNAAQRGAIYDTSGGQDIPGGASIATSAWMKGTSGATLEIQVVIFNTDGTTSGGITSFKATGAWQREGATATVTVGKTADKVQILVQRRFAAGQDTFLVDRARLSRVTSSTRVHVAIRRTGSVVPLSAFSTGVGVNLRLGLNQIVLSTRRHDVVLNGVTLKK